MPIKPYSKILFIISAEGDLCSIAQLKNFYDSSKIETKELFSKESRPNVVKLLYAEAGVGVTYNFDCSDIRNISSDQNEDSNNKSIDLICTPVFGKKNRQMQERIDADIEIRMVRSPLDFDWFLFP